MNDAAVKYIRKETIANSVNEAEMVILVGEHAPMTIFSFTVSPPLPLCHCHMYRHIHNCVCVRVCACHSMSHDIINACETVVVGRECCVSLDYFIAFALIFLYNPGSNKGRDIPNKGHIIILVGLLYTYVQLHIFPSNRFFLSVSTCILIEILCNHV